MADALTVLMWPARRNRHDNTYTLRLSEALEKESCRVLEFTPGTALSGEFDILHIHWPEAGLSKNALKSMMRAIALTTILAVVSKIRKKTVIWTVHNFRPHKQVHEMSLVLLKWGLRKFVSGHIFLSYTSKRESGLLEKPSAVIGIGRYSREFVPDETRQRTRELLGVHGSAKLVAYVGRIERYKGVLELVRSFVGGPDSAVRLVIVGNCRDSAYSNEIMKAACGNPDIIIKFGWLYPIEYANIVQAADLVVCPYLDIQNSGSILSPLELRTPVLAPAIGSIPEVSDAVGRGWIVTYHQPFEWGHVEDALEAGKPGAGPDMSKFEWGDIGTKTAVFYRSMIWRESHRA